MSQLKQTILLIITGLTLSACVTSQPPKDEPQETTTAAQTPVLNAPQNIHFADKEYTLINTDEKDIDNNKVTTYQYTSDGQTIQNWASIISIAYNTKEVTTEEILNLMKTSLENTQPKPVYNITYHEDEQFAVAQIIYSPQENYPAYESSAWILNFKLNCPGYTSLQYALRYRPDTAIDTIVAENNAMTEYLVNNRFPLDCQESTK